MENSTIKRQDETLMELGQTGRRRVRAAGKRRKVSQRREKKNVALEPAPRHETHLTSGRHSVMSAGSSGRSSAEELDERLTGQLGCPSASGHCEREQVQQQQQREREEEVEVEQEQPAAVAEGICWPTGSGRAMSFESGIAHGGGGEESKQVAHSMSTCGGGGGARTSRRQTSFAAGALGERESEQAQVDFCLQGRGEVGAVPRPPAGQESDPARGLVEERASSPPAGFSSPSPLSGSSSSSSLTSGRRGAPADSRRVTQQPGERVGAEGAPAPARRLVVAGGDEEPRARQGAGQEPGERATGDIEFAEQALAGWRRTASVAAAATPSWSANGIDHHHHHAFQCCSPQKRPANENDSDTEQCKRQAASTSEQSETRRRERRRDAIGHSEDARAAESPLSEFYSSSSETADASADNAASQPPSLTTKGARRHGHAGHEHELRKKEEGGAATQAPTTAVPEEAIGEEGVKEASDGRSEHEEEEGEGGEAEDEVASCLLELEIDGAIECWPDECPRAIASATTTSDSSEGTIGREHESGQRAHWVLSERQQQRGGQFSQRRAAPLPMTSTMGQASAAGQQLLRRSPPGRFESENHTIVRLAAGLGPASATDDHSMPQPAPLLPPPTQQQQQQQRQADHECDQPQPLQRQYPANHPLGNSKHLCSICGDRATGKHYGVYSCEGCKGFFKRTIRKDIVYVCRSAGACLIDMRQRNRCQYCRYQKCLQRGMKREAVQEEKQRLKLRAAAAQAAGGLNASSQLASANANLNGSAGPHHHYNTNHYLAVLDSDNNNNNNHSANNADQQLQAETQLSSSNSNANPANRSGRCDTQASQQQQAAEHHFARVESPTGSQMFGPTAAQAGLQAGHTQTQAFSPYQQQHQHHFRQQPNESTPAAGGQSPEANGREPGQQRLAFGPQQTAMIEQLQPQQNTASHQLQYHQFQQQQQLNASATTIQHHRNSLQHHHHHSNNHFRLASDTRQAQQQQSPGQARIDELTLKWAAQVQIERLLDWAKSVPSFTELLVDDQVTLLKAYWNELLIAEIAFMSAACLREGSLPRARSRRSSSGSLSPPGGRQQLRQHVDALCIGRGLFLTEQQAHELGLGSMFERIVNELVCKMAEMRLDANELACLREIILFNPETHGLKTSQPIEEYRGNIYTYLELYCRKQHEREPNRFGKLLLRLPVLRSIGLKCQASRLYSSDFVPAGGPASASLHAHYSSSDFSSNNLGSPASSGASSVNSNCSSQLSASSGHSSQLVSTTTASPLGSSRATSNVASASYHQARLLFFELVYESTPVDAFLRSSLATH